MARFKVFYIDRDGVVNCETVLARTRRHAYREALSRHDDIIKVKRNPVKIFSSLVVLVVIAALYFVLFVL